MKDKQTIIDERWQQIIQSKIDLFGKHKDWINRYQLLIENIRNRYPFTLLYPFTSHHHLRFSFDKNLQEYWNLYIFINPSFKTEKGLFEVGIDEYKIVYFNDVNEAVDEFARTLLRQPAHKVMDLKPLKIVNSNTEFEVFNIDILHENLSFIEINFLGENYQKNILWLFNVEEANNLISTLKKLELKKIKINYSDDKTMSFWFNNQLIGSYKINSFIERTDFYSIKDWIKRYETSKGKND